MLYFANPCRIAIPYMEAGIIGFIDTPRQGNKRPQSIWCADNGCFGKGWPGYDAWLAWLERNRHDVALCAFATAPDVVGDAEATLARSRPWLPEIRARGYPAAFVAQNGQEDLTVPWAEFDSLFIGGSPYCPDCGYIRPPDAPPLRKGERPRCPDCEIRLVEWKLQAGARRLVEQGVDRGKWVHMGRVNSRIRYNYAKEIGCHSVDGTYLTFGASKNLPQLLEWVSA